MKIFVSLRFPDPLPEPEIKRVIRAFRAEHLLVSENRLSFDFDMEESEEDGAATVEDEASEIMLTLDGLRLDWTTLTVRKGSGSLHFFPKCHAGSEVNT